MSFIQEHQESHQSSNVWRIVLRLWLCASVFILPLFILPGTRDVINLPKSYLLFLVTTVGIFLWVGMLMATRESVVRVSILDGVLGVLLGGTLISTLFSKALSLSVVGRADTFTLNFLFLAASIFWVWLIIQVCDSKKHVEWFLQLFLGSVGVANVLFLLRETAAVSRLFRDQVLQSISVVNSVFIMCVAVVAVLSLGLFLIKGRSWLLQIVPGFAGILSILTLFYTHFFVAWVVYLVGVGCLVLMSIALVKHTSMSRASLVFILFLLGLSAIIFPFSSPKQATLPVEVALGAEASWDIVRPAWLSSAKTFFIGSGPGTFSIAFSQYRSAQFNLDSLAWTTRFTVPFNSFFAFLSEMGLIGILPLIFVILVIFGNVFTALRRVQQAFAKSPQELAEACGPEYVAPFVLFAAWISATVALFLSFADVVLWLTWWLLLALLLMSLSRMVTGVVRRKVVSLTISSQYTLAFSFGMILVVFGVLVFGTIGYKNYSAERQFSRVVGTRNVEEQAMLMDSVLEKRSGYAEYQLGRARLHVERARQSAGNENTDVRLVADELSKAVERVKGVTTRYPYAIDAWELLGVIYMNTRAITPEANAWALDAIEHAITLEPSNPLLFWRQGNIEIYAEDYVAAEASFIRAIELKPDYIVAYTDLSALYEQQEELNKAINVYQPIMPVVQDNSELLFQLGKLFYNRNTDGDLDRAEQVWLRGAQITPEHSNTLYSLGLLYERWGQMSKAREHFSKVKELNPDNEDILTKLHSL